MENISVYENLLKFKKKYPLTVAWRLKKHAKVIQEHLNPGETVQYAFAAQKNQSSLEMFFTHIIVLTNKRILIASKRVLFGYLYNAITPDMFNDLTIERGLIWGRVNIDTVKETVGLSNIQCSALQEIETEITEYMIREKQELYQKN